MPLVHWFGGAVVACAVALGACTKSESPSEAADINSIVQTIIHDINTPKPTEALGGYPVLHTIQTIGTPEQISVLAWSPDGKSAAGTDWHGKTVYLWNLGSGEKVWQVEKAYGTGSDADLAFSQDGSFIVTSFTENPRQVPAGALSLISVKTGKVIRHVMAEAPPSGFNNAGAFSLDGGLATVVLGPNSGSVAVFDSVQESTTGWNHVRYLGPVINHSGHSRGIQRVILDAANNKVVLQFVPNEIQVWSLSENSQLSQFDAFSVSGVRAMVLHGPTGMLIVGGNRVMTGDRKNPPKPDDKMPAIIAKMKHDDFSTLLRAWNPLAGEEQLVFDGPVAGVIALRISPNGRLLAVIRSQRDDSYVILHDIQSGAIVGGLSSRNTPLSGLAFSPDGTRLAYADRFGINIVACPVLQ